MISNFIDWCRQRYENLLYRLTFRGVCPREYTQDGHYTGFNCKGNGHCVATHYWVER